MFTFWGFTFDKGGLPLVVALPGCLVIVFALVLIIIQKCPLDKLLFTHYATTMTSTISNILVATR